MSNVVGCDSSFPNSSDMQMSGTTLRRLEDEISGEESLAKSKTVVRVPDAVQRCGTTASECSSISESSEAHPEQDFGCTEYSEPVVADQDDSVNAFQQDTSSDLVIFDYDDTILPTYVLACSQKNSSGQLLDPEKISDGLERLTEAVLANLNKVIRMARLVVVTNASYDWLTQSCERYLPRIAEFFAEHSIRIISARDRLENSLLAQRHWKYFIFIDLIEEYFMDQLKGAMPFTVTSIGDGAEEREACMKLAAIFKNQKWAFKNLKFLTQPTLGCLVQQHVLLAKSFDNFFNMKSSADLCILFDKNKSRNEA
ncbi:uncharacterized protein BXIN_0827 [Babesia sp. Xinjiang]|uniref:uncharacterized protein n=1 Tax=Babesia sp. Xinjiang TaxID=462227 RepID=UPI000A240442|nr:uncharacterized protein BXIN_0827 [Babesia sp. Xinjiang]ORM41280.1 hypothetical protein BXIN_0827 [Babesia sp. Xinjiang]